MVYDKNDWSSNADLSSPPPNKWLPRVIIGTTAATILAAGVGVRSIYNGWSRQYSNPHSDTNPHPGAAARSSDIQRNVDKMDAVPPHALLDTDIATEPTTAPTTFGEKVEPKETTPSQSPRR